MDNPSVHVFDSLETLSEAAARATVAQIANTPSDQSFSIALSGGSTPKTYHSLLATTFRDAIPWERIHLFWGDDRYVPHDDPASNYRMARESLIDHVPIPDENVHPIPTDAILADQAAESYADTLALYFGQRPPALDLAIMGLGDDGHTASLFPGTDVLEENNAWVRALEAPPYAQPRTRVTLTYPLLNQSKAIFFLAAGVKKRTVLNDILTNPASTYPAARISSPSLHWFIDEAAHMP